MNKRIPLLLLAAVFTAFAAGSFQPVSANNHTRPGTGARQQPGAGGQALEIAPPVINLSANPGQTVRAQILLRNISSSTLIVNGQANDFVAAGEDGTPKLLLEEGEPSPYSLKAWVGALPRLSLVPKEIKTLAVNINVPADASPGGHYGVIRFTGTPAELNTTGVSLSASLGTLVLLTVNGNVKEKLSVQEFSANRSGKSGSFFESGPLSFVEKFKNEGNVHVQPTGQVTITDLLGKKVAALNVNTPPGNVLPDSVRKFQQPLDKSVLGNKRLFGRYTAELKVTYGAGKQVATSKFSFWVIPYKLLLAAAVLLVAAFFGIRAFLRWYNKRIIARAQGSGRRR